MRLLRRTGIYIIGVCFLLGLFGSMTGYAQQDDHSFLNIKTGDADRESSSASTGSAARTDGIYSSNSNNKKKFYWFASLEGGTADLYYKIPAGKMGSQGPTGAGSVQIAHRLRSHRNYRQMFVSAGLELRNINNIMIIPSTHYGIVYDNLYLLYGGVPLMFQYINTKHTPGFKNDVNLYGQAGVNMDYQLYMYDHRKDHIKAWNDKKENFNPFLIQPFVSAGISYTTRRNVFLLGPFLSYTVNDISKPGAVKGSFACYGMKVSAIRLK